MADNIEIEKLVKDHLPDDMDKQRKQEIAAQVASLAVTIFGLGSLTSGIFSSSLFTSLLQLTLHSFKLDFTDIDQLIQEILRKLREK